MYDHLEPQEPDRRSLDFTGASDHTGGSEAVRDNWIASGPAKKAANDGDPRSLEGQGIAWSATVDSWTNWTNECAYSPSSEFAVWVRLRPRRAGRTGGGGAETQVKPKRVLSHC